MIIEFQPPCYVQARQPPDQAAQSHIQPGPECLQGWGIHKLLVPVHHHPLCENLPLISNLNLPCLSLKAFSLVLSISTLENSRSPLLFICSLQVPEGHSEVSSELSCLQAIQGPFCQPFLIGEVVRVLIILVILLSTHFKKS